MGDHECMWVGGVESEIILGNRDKRLFQNQAPWGKKKVLKFERQFMVSLLDKYNSQFLQRIESERQRELPEKTKLTSTARGC